MPGSFGAEFSLYRSTAWYRLPAGDSMALRRRGPDCIASCMARCDVDVATCRRECQAECSFAAPCPPGQHTCWGSAAPHHRCCPADTSCCVYFERPSLRTRIACCAPGQQCCLYGGCYDPDLQQCREGGLSNCPPGREPCGEVCCAQGEVCTSDGCSPATEACLGRRCAPGQACTPQGCCDRARVALNGCCPPERLICDGKCCAPGETCRQTSAGGFCVQSLQ